MASATPCGYGSPVGALQEVLHGHGAQPGQVGRVVQMLGGDHRRGLRQGQRQESQLAAPAPRAPASSVRPVRWARNDSASCSVNTSTATASPSPPVSSWLLVMITWHCPAAGTNRPQPVQVGGVVEHHQAPLPVGLQPVADRLPDALQVRARLADAEPAAAIPPARSAPWP